MLLNAYCSHISISVHIVISVSFVLQLYGAEEGHTRDELRFPPKS